MEFTLDSSRYKLLDSPRARWLMRKQLRAVRLVISFIFRADRKLAWTALVLTPLTSIAPPVTALGVKFVVDGIVVHSIRRCMFGASLLAAAVACVWALDQVYYRVMTALAERTG